jgi:opacity protein-like surface antigen
MKKLYFSIVAILLSGTAFAQLQTGTKFAGLHAGASLSKESAFNKTTSYEIAPTAGYFLTNKLMVGIQGGYGRTVTEENRQVLAGASSGSGFTSYTIMARSAKTTAYSAGVTARYYLPVVDKFAFFVESGAGYSKAKVKVDYQSEQYTSPDPNGQPAGNHWGAPGYYNQASNSQRLVQDFLYGSIAPGMVYFPTPKIGVELRANMISYIYSPDNGSQVQAAFNLSKTNVGVGFYF